MGISSGHQQCGVEPNWHWSNTVWSCKVKFASSSVASDHCFKKQPKKSELTAHAHAVHCLKPIEHNILIGRTSHSSTLLQSPILEAVGISSALCSFNQMLLSLGSIWGVHWSCSQTPRRQPFSLLW
jgi:hypothetical protein